MATTDTKVTEATIKPPATSTNASGRDVHLAAETDTALPPNAPQTEVKIGSVQDALKSNVPTVSAEDSGKSQEPAKNSEPAPILSVAQLQQHHIRNGTAPTTEQVNEVRKLEEKWLEEGGKQLRTNKE